MSRIPLLGVQGYQQMLGASAGIPAAATVVAQPTSSSLAKLGGLFDAVGPFDVDAMDAAYIQKRQAAHLGSRLRMS